MASEQTLYQTPQQRKQTVVALEAATGAFFDAIVDVTKSISSSETFHVDVSGLSRDHRTLAGHAEYFKQIYEKDKKGDSADVRKTLLRKALPCLASIGRACVQSIKSFGSQESLVKLSRIEEQYAALNLLLQEILLPVAENSQEVGKKEKKALSKSGASAKNVEDFKKEWDQFFDKLTRVETEPKKQIKTTYPKGQLPPAEKSIRDMGYRTAARPGDAFLFISPKPPSLEVEPEPLPVLVVQPDKGRGTRVKKSFSKDYDAIETRIGRCHVAAQQIVNETHGDHREEMEHFRDKMKVHLQELVLKLGDAAIAPSAASLREDRKDPYSWSNKIRDLMGSKSEGAPIHEPYLEFAALAPEPRPSREEILTEITNGHLKGIYYLLNTTKDASGDKLIPKKNFSKQGFIEAYEEILNYFKPGIGNGR